jgi:phosphatidylserine decarboxylase
MTATPQHLQQRLLGMVADSPDLVEDEDDLQLDALDTEDLRDLDDSDTESPDSEQRPPGQVDLEKTTTNEKHKRRLKLARLKKKAKERAYEFSGLSDMAGVLFLEIQKVTDLPPEKNSKAHVS